MSLELNFIKGKDGNFNAGNVYDNIQSSFKVYYNEYWKTWGISALIRSNMYDLEINVRRKQYESPEKAFHVTKPAVIIMTTFFRKTGHRKRSESLLPMSSDTASRPLCS